MLSISSIIRTIGGQHWPDTVWTVYILFGLFEAMCGGCMCVCVASFFFYIFLFSTSAAPRQSSEHDVLVILCQGETHISNAQKKGEKTV